MLFRSFLTTPTVSSNPPSPPNNPLPPPLHPFRSTQPHPPPPRNPLAFPPPPSSAPLELRGAEIYPGLEDPFLRLVTNPNLPGLLRLFPFCSPLFCLFCRECEQSDPDISPFISNPRPVCCGFGRLLLGGVLLLMPSGLFVQMKRRSLGSRRLDLVLVYANFCRDFRVLGVRMIYPDLGLASGSADACIAVFKMTEACHSLASKMWDGLRLDSSSLPPGYGITHALERDNLGRSRKHPLLKSLVG